MIEMFIYILFRNIYLELACTESAMSEAKVDQNAETLFLIKIHRKTSILWTCIILFHEVIPLQ